MDDAAYRAYFERPTHTYHRRYEALRAVFIDRRSQKDVAQEFGFTCDSLRQLVSEFRQYCDAHEKQVESPFFETLPLDVLQSTTTKLANQRLRTAGSSSSPQANR